MKESYVTLVRAANLQNLRIKLNSAAVVVTHNHPSGDPTPSPEDVLVTREIVEAGKLLDIDVLDHLVIGQGKWFSMREKGLGFSKNVRIFIEASFLQKRDTIG